MDYDYAAHIEFEKKFFSDFEGDYFKESRTFYTDVNNTLLLIDCFKKLKFKIGAVDGYFLTLENNTTYIQPVGEYSIHNNTAFPQRPDKYYDCDVASAFVRSIQEKRRLIWFFTLISGNHK
jgi:hypothetical protein